MQTGATMPEGVPELLRLGPKIAVLPVIHGSGQCALTVRRWMLEYDFDCVAVPLPASFQEQVEEAVLQLPQPGIVIQPARQRFEPSEWAEPTGWTPEPWSAEGDADWSEEDEADGDEESVPLSYVPIDPCQPVIMAIRAALGEHVPRAFVDLETDPFMPMSATMPDPYALRHVAPERFAAALLPGIPRPPDRQTRDRLEYMAWRLGELERQYDRILFVCSVLHWPWIRQQYQAGVETLPAEDVVEPPQRYELDPRSLLFLFGEIPYITGLYERARAELEDDENLSIDGVKQLLMASRDAYRTELGRRARRITPLLLSQCLKYIRNLSLIARRMTPDLYTMVTASKQILGDQFALHLVETARAYPYGRSNQEAPSVTLGIDQCRLPDGETVPLVSRLPGPETTWQTVELQRRPTRDEAASWEYRWNPYRQCSYPPEDVRIENFRARVFDRAKAITGADLATTEKF